MAGRLSVLWVAPSSEPRPRFLDQLGDRGLRVTHALTCDEARRVLAGDRSFELVVSSAHLGDGNWYSVLSSLVHQGSRSEFVVVADEVNDSFRRRVRELGGADAVPLGTALRPASRVSRAVRAARAS